MTEEPLDEDVTELQDTFGAPPVLAVVAFVLAVLSVAGFGLLNGTTYTVPLIDALPTEKGPLVGGSLLGALLALVPVVLGWRAASRALPDDAAWVATLARSAVLLGLLGAALRVVVALVQATADGGGGFSRV